MDLLAEGVLPPDDYRAKREQYKSRQVELVNLIHAYDDADNVFGSTMEKLMKVAMGAHKAFMSSNLEEKRELLNFVFSNLTLKGETLCYSYNFPFNNFENLDDCSKWRRVVNTFRTNAPDCLLIVQHKINYTSSQIIRRLAA